MVLGQDGCRDPSSDDQRAVMIGQSVCFICPQGTANIEWKYELAPVNLEPGLTDFPNGTLLIASVQSNYIGRPFSCRNTNTLSQTSFSLTEACKSACMHVRTFTCVGVVDLIRSWFGVFCHGSITMEF